jgi:ubiquinone/menaquinone biosynthesis C-methylase UbiE
LCFQQKIVFKKRSEQLERIDTGDYTTAEYDACLSDLRFINRWIGDAWALQKTLLREISATNLSEFSVLDVGAGSGELLRDIAKFARKTGRKAKLYGLELNQISANSIKTESTDFNEISAIRGTAFSLPLTDKSIDYIICSLFTHHFTDENVVGILREFNRISRRGIFVIDLHRHPIAYGLYKIFCAACGISQMVRQDGSLSVLRGFKPDELVSLAEKAGLQNVKISSHFPYRLVLQSN